MPIILKVPVFDEWEKFAQVFEMRGHFPHCLGAVDRKHVIVQVICKIFYKFFINYFIMLNCMFLTKFLGVTKFWIYALQL